MNHPFQRSSYRSQSLKSALALSSALVCLLTFWQYTMAQTPTGAGIIEGQAIIVSNGSTASLNNLPVSLFTFIDGARQVPPAVGQTDAQGRVRFTQMNTSSHYTYTMFIKFQDTIFPSGVISFTANSLSAQADVKVFDSVRDNRSLIIDQHHLIIDLASDGPLLNIIELYELTNTSDRVISGAPDSDAQGKSVSFRALLPPNAILDSIEERTLGTDIFQVGNQLLDTKPIPPGQSQLALAYQLPFQRTTLALAIGTTVTNSALNLLVAPGIGVRGQRLTTQSAVQAGTRLFQHYSTRDLAANTPIAVELNDLPAPLIPLDLLQWLPLTVISLALAGVLFTVLRRKNAYAATRG